MIIIIEIISIIREDIKEIINNQTENIIMKEIIKTEEMIILMIITKIII